MQCSWCSLLPSFSGRNILYRGSSRVHGSGVQNRLAASSRRSAFLIPWVIVNNPTTTGIGWVGLEQIRVTSQKCPGSCGDSPKTQLLPAIHYGAPKLSAAIETSVAIPADYRGADSNSPIPVWATRRMATPAYSCMRKTEVDFALVKDFFLARATTNCSITGRCA